MNEHVRTITAHELEPQMRLLSPAYFGTFAEKTRRMIATYPSLGLELSVSSRMEAGRITAHRVRFQIASPADRFVIVVDVPATTATLNQAIFMATIEMEVWLEEVGYDDVSAFIFDETKPTMRDLETYGITPEDEVAHMLAVIESDDELRELDASRRE